MDTHDTSFKIELVSDGTVSQLSRKLAHEIQDCGYVPDIVVAIARGGYVPARLLCDLLDIYNLTSIRIRHYTGPEKSETADLCEPLGTDISGLNVLLVDDVDDTGDTLQVALNYLKSHDPATIKTCVLHHKMNSIILPDFYGENVLQWCWLTYPWAIIEDVRKLVKKMDPPPVNVEKAIQWMQKEYGLEISTQVMEDVFR
jgi:hypoxanthine phosphoribosyltransferase